jgi:small subunit ribosomal protein S2
MAYLTMKQLLEAGVHFGHQTKRWNPKMKRYIFGARNGIYIIDLQQTVRMFKTAYDFIRETTSEGGSVLFVGTKRQAQTSIMEESARCDMSYVNQRWIGGLLTNFATVKKSIKKLIELDEMKADGYSTVIKKEGVMLEKSRLKLEKTLGGLREMKKIPTAVFVVDTKKEAIAVKEAKKLNIPVIGIVDSNCDPDEVDFIIPGNDDAIRAIKLFSGSVADACLEGGGVHQEKLQAEQNKLEKEMAEKAAVEEARAKAIAEVAAREEAKKPAKDEKKAQPEAKGVKAKPAAKPAAKPTAKPEAKKAAPPKEEKAEPAAKPAAKKAEAPKEEAAPAKAEAAKE